jgi:hypothetical protein
MKYSLKLMLVKSATSALDTVKRNFGRGALVLTTAAIIGMGAVGHAAASETKGYVVKWFHMATYSEDAACPEGLNPRSEEIFLRILNDMGTPPEKIEEIMADFPNTMYYYAGRRGKIDGKPVDVYLNPTSVPDPLIKTVQDNQGLGFNLDGKDTAEDFIDTETGERGVDNQLYRALGCIGSLRSAPDELPTHPSIQWDMVRDQMPAWLVEISGIDDLQNDDDVQVSVYRAKEPVVRDAVAEPQADMTFHVDPNPRMENRARGMIKDGVLTTEPFDFYMIGDPFAIPEYDLGDARLRFTWDEDGNLNGVLGGYQSWETVYWSFASGGSVNEANVSVDVPGIYYALRNLADGRPDPQTGMNMAISASYIVEAVPAFIERDPAQTAAVQK